MLGAYPVASLPVADSGIESYAFPYGDTERLLPHASPGLHYSFVVVTGVIIVAQPNETIRDATETGTVYSSNAAGSFAELFAISAGQWFVTKKTGTWELSA